MNFDIKAIKEEQKKLAKKILLKTEFDNVKYIAGIDNAYIDNKIISVITVLNYETLELIEYKHSIGIPKTPHIPGFSSFREVEFLMDAYNQLEIKPDIIIVDGDGILHTKGLGIASHLGILLELPTIGISTKINKGHVKKERIIVNEQVKGYALKTRDKALPIYVSPGHMIGLKKTLEITKKLLTGNKLPAPIHLAHKFAIKLKRQEKENK